MTSRSSERDPAGSGSGRVPLPRDAIDHLDSLYRGALRLTRNRARAEDLVRDTYVRALHFQGGSRSGTSTRTWLFAVMHNVFWDRHEGGRHDILSRDDGEGSLDESIEGDEPGFEAMSLDRVDHREVVRAVDGLPEIHREVVLLVDVEGFTYKESAEILGVPVGTMISRLRRARFLLRQALVPCARQSRPSRRAPRPQAPRGDPP